MRSGQWCGDDIDLEGELFELDGQIDRIDGDVGGDGQGDGSEVEDAAHAGGDDAIGDFLGDIGRDGEDGELDGLGLEGLLEFIQGLDGEADGVGTDLGGVGIKDGREAESLGMEASVGHEGAAEIAGTDEDDIPGFVGAEDMSDLADQLLDAVADAGMAELSEIGEILADLGIGEAEAFAQLLGRDGPLVLAGKRLQLAQV